MGPQVLDASLQTTCVAAADFDRDGSLDLAAVEGSERVSIFLQDPVQQGGWTSRRVTVGLGSYFVLTADFDTDGSEDLAIADPGSGSAYILRSRGDGTFDPPASLPEANGSRWLAAGDFDGDGSPDLATANFMNRNCSVFLGNGTAALTFARRYRTEGLPHAIQSLDFDGDDRLDLMVKLSDVGIAPLHGTGDGAFEPFPLITSLGTDGNILAGDLNLDGKGDLAIECCGVGVSLGDGTYRKVLAFEGFSRASFVDLDQDGHVDVVQSVARPEPADRNLRFHAGTADGSFRTAVSFGAEGLPFANFWDLDGDGPLELVSGSTGSSGLVRVQGIEGDSFLEHGLAWSGFTNARVMAVYAPTPGQGPDFFFPSTTEPEVKVYQSPGLSAMAAPSRTIRTASPYTSLVVADMDGDGIEDLAGANGPNGDALLSIGGPTGQPRQETVRPAGLIPLGVLVGLLDGDFLPDLAVACFGDNQVVVFPGEPGGSIGPGVALPTIDRPREVAAGDLNGDGRLDLVVAAADELSIHTVEAQGGFSTPSSVLEEAAHFHADVSLTDIDGDGFLDLAYLERNGGKFCLQKGSGSGGFEAAVSYPVGELPVSLATGDIDADGLVDVSSTSDKRQSVSVLLNRGEAGFIFTSDAWLGFSPQGHALSDLDLDGELDLVVHRANAALVLPSRRGGAPSAQFVRGDANADGKLDLSDAVRALGALFLGTSPLACADAADANDDGAVNITDAVYVLEHLFRAGLAPPGPYPERGADPTQDVLRCEG